MKIKEYEQLIIKLLEEKPPARKDDFILYGLVLKNCGISLDMSLKEFFLTHKKIKAPNFKTIERNRRHIQRLRPDLKDSKTAIAREEKIEEYREYNLTSIGDK